MLSKIKNLFSRLRGSGSVQGPARVTKFEDLFEVSTVVNFDTKLDEALRRATALKKAGDWTGALDTLRACKAMLIVTHVAYPTEVWCKYPLYLQRAGRYEESMAEFQWLLDNEFPIKHRDTIEQKLQLAQARQAGTRR